MDIVRKAKEIEAGLAEGGVVIQGRRNGKTLINNVLRLMAALREDGFKEDRFGHFVRPAKDERHRETRVKMQKNSVRYEAAYRKSDGSKQWVRLAGCTVNNIVLCKNGQVMVGTSTFGSVKE